MKFEELAKKLKKEYDDDNYLQKANIVPGYQRLQTQALGMDYALFGGLPLGRICVISGQQHSGKTTATFAQISAYQKAFPDKMCLFVDVEQSADIQFQVNMNGVDTEKLTVLKPKVGQSGEQILADVLDFQQNVDDIGMIVIDSIPALVPSANLTNDFEKDNGRRGTIAGPLHKFCSNIVSSLREKNNILIFINQVRKVGTTYNGFPIFDEPGGDAPKYYSSVSIRFGTRKLIRLDEELSSSDSEGADGFKLLFKITKNKTASCTRGGGFISYRYETGMDTTRDLLEIATTFGFISKITSKTYALINCETGEILLDEDGNELKGYKKTLIEYLNTHKEFKDKYLKMLTDFISSSNTIKLLSKEEDEEIDKANNGCSDTI